MRRAHEAISVGYGYIDNSPLAYTFIHVYTRFLVVTRGVYDNVRLFTIWEYNDKLVEPLLNRHGAVHSASVIFVGVFVTYV